MALRIPSNQIVKSKYTIGKEYMFESTYREYQGYYYELNGKLFAGKEFNNNAPVLVKINSLNNTNLLQTNPSTFVYGIISGIKLDNTKINSYYFNVDTTDNVFRYFIKKVNENIIKEINEDTFNQIQSNPIYLSVSLYYQSGFNENDLNNADKKISGLKEYINTTYAPGVTD
jgi:hypothetical protein